MRITLLAIFFIAFYVCFTSCVFAQTQPLVPKNPVDNLNGSNIPLPNPNVIIVSTALGSNLACVGSASQPANVQHFTVSGNYLTDGVTVTAPAGFEISLASGSGYSNNIILSQLAPGGILNRTAIYVRLAAGDALGRAMGNVTLTSTGAPSQSVLVWGIVYALPTVNPVSSQTKVAGTATDPINFTGTGNTFSWYNDNTTIGLTTSATGNIPPFTTINNGTTPITATIKVTPTNDGILYVADLENNNLEAINTTTRVVTNIPTPNNPSCVATSLDGTRAYLTNFNNGQQGSVSVINTLTNSIIKNIQVGNAPFSVSVTPDGKWVYVTNVDFISVINATTNTLYKNIQIKTPNTELTMSADGSLLYISNSPSNTTDSLSIYSTATNTELYRIPLPNDGQHFSDILISPDGSKLYGNNYYSDTVKVIDIPATIKTNKINIIANIVAGAVPTSVTISPDGSRIYAANEGANSVTVIDATNNTVIATIPTAYPIPDGLTVSPDGNYLYLINSNNNIVSVIDTKTNKITDSYSGGPPMFSWTAGNFLVPATGCPGMPTTFTITVLPKNAIPSFMASTATGTISGCSGVASASPDLQQFTVSGNNLTDAVTATAPTGFEVSLTANEGYGTNVMLNQVQGVLKSTTVYVRSAAANGPGPVSGNVTVSFPGLANQYVAVSANINATPTVDHVPDQTLTNGDATTPVVFTGTGNATFSWTNSNPGIGLPSLGSGNINSFAVINSGNVPVVATITVTPTNTTNCSGTPATFTITVNPTVTLNASGNLLAFTTTYGTSSSAQTFTVSGTNISSGILVIAPEGFEVSTDGITYNTAVTVNGTGDISAATVFIRLASSVTPGNYSGPVTLSTNYAPNTNITVPNSTINPAQLTVIADNKTKLYGDANPALTATYNGFVNNEGPPALSKQPDVNTIATTLSPFGQYPIIASNAVSANYIFTYLPGILTIKPLLSSLFIPNTFTPNGDGINDTWEIDGLEYYTQATVNIFNRWGQKLYSSTGYTIPWNGNYNGKPLASGTYYYIIDPKNGQSVISGWVAIVR